VDYTERLSGLKKLLQEALVKEAQYKVAVIKLQAQIELLETLTREEATKKK
jgi:hypothetical protein